MTKDHARLAVAAAREGDFATAIDHDARAFASEPGDPAPIHHLIAMLLDCGKWIGAMAAIELVKERPVTPEVELALDLAACEVMRKIAGTFPPAGMREDTDAIIERLVSGNHDLATRLAIARMLVDLNRVAEARRILAATEPETPEDRGNAAFLRGVLCEREGDLANARVMYELALAIDAHRGDAAINLVSMLLRDGDTASISALLDGLDPKVRAMPELRFNEAMYLRRIGRVDAARAILSEVATPHSEIGRIAKQVLIAC
jgi:Flp pilus assembly protein TadD